MFCGPLLWQFGLIARVVTIASLPFFGSALGLYVYHRFGPGKYNLDELRELVLEGKYDDSESQEVDPEGDLFCPYCQTVYNVKFGVCPSCATRQTRKS